MPRKANKWNLFRKKHEHSEKSMKVLSRMYWLQRVQPNLSLFDPDFSKKLFQSFRGLYLDKSKFMSFLTTRVEDYIYFSFRLKDSEPVYKCAKNGCPEWKDIQCDEESNPSLKTPCFGKEGENISEERASKIFVHGYRNLWEYVRALQAGKVSAFTHNVLWEKVRRTLINHPDWVVLNHNRDVNTFHLKFESRPYD
jgi:hypothetical protein